MKLCVDCKYFTPSKWADKPDLARCTRPMTYLGVRGNSFAEHERNWGYGNYCGPSAKFFEEKGPAFIEVPAPEPSNPIGPWYRGWFRPWRQV